MMDLTKIDLIVADCGTLVERLQQDERFFINQFANTINYRIPGTGCFVTAGRIHIVEQDLGNGNTCKLYGVVKNEWNQVTDFDKHVGEGYGILSDLVSDLKITLGN